MSLLRFSPLSENILAAVTGGSYVAIWELNLHEQGVSKVREREIKNVPYNYIEIFANFTTCSQWQRFYHAIFLSCVKDWIEDMATFTEGSIYIIQCHVQLFCV